MTLAPVQVDWDTAFKERVAETKARLIERGVEYCFASWVDIHGRPKGKFVPIERFEHLAGGSEAYTVQAFDGMGALGPQADDQAAVPDLDSLIVFPWDKRYAWMVGDIYWRGEPYEFDSRTILKRNIRKAAERGYALNLGIEPEFYILRRDDDGTVRPFAVNDVGPCWSYDVELTLDSMPILSVLQKYMDELGWDVSSFDHEGGHGQYEFDFGYTDVLSMCDRFIFLRLMAKEVAKRFGCFATFMPKPFADDFRSGAHFNMSIADVETGKNLMMDPTDPRGIGYSKTAYGFVGGLLRHTDALAAVCCPTVNSYKGLIPGGIDPTGVARDMSWAPVYATYGDNNRAAMLRLPLGRDCVENRAVDMAVNVYWAAAMSLAAGLEGITQNTDPGQPSNVDLYSLTQEELDRRGIQLLPRTLNDAVNGFDADPLTERVFGAGPKQEFVDLKRAEWARYHSQITDWEWERYANFF